MTLLEALLWAMLVWSLVVLSGGCVFLMLQGLSVRHKCCPTGVKNL